MGYVGLHHHTTYSFLEAIGQVKDHASRVAELGMTAMSITDYSAIYGAMDLYKSVKDFGLKPIFGVDMPWVRQLGKRDPQYRGYITFLAKDIEGYHTLLRLVSAAYMRRESGEIPFVDMDLLREDCQQIMAFRGGVDSWYGHAIVRGEDRVSIQDEGRVLVDLLGQDNVFAEIVAQDYSLLPNVKKVNDALLDDAREWGINAFVSNDVRYIQAKDAEAFEVARAIKDNKKIYDEDRRKVVGEYHIVDGDWIVKMMTRNGYDEATIAKRIDQTQEIADRIDIHIDLGETLFPHYQVADRLKEIYKREKDNLVVG